MAVYGQTPSLKSRPEMGCPPFASPCLVFLLVVAACTQAPHENLTLTTRTGNVMPDRGTAPPWWRRWVPRSGGDDLDAGERDQSHHRGGRSVGRAHPTYGYAAAGIILVVCRSHRERDAVTFWRNF
jgi:hypothetical protein